MFDSVDVFEELGGEGADLLKSWERGYIGVRVKKKKNHLRNAIDGVFETLLNLQIVDLKGEITQGGVRLIEVVQDGFLPLLQDGGEVGVLWDGIQEF